MIENIDWDYIGRLTGGFTNVIIFLSTAGPIIVGFCIWLHKIFTDVNFLVKELKPNGGSSIRDAINRIDRKLSAIDFSQKTHWNLDTKKPIFITDGDGMLVWANTAFLNIVSRPLEDLLGNGWQNSIHQDDRNNVRVEWSSACKESRPFDFVFRVFKYEQNESFYIRCSARGDSSTGFIGILEIFPDSKISVEKSASESDVLIPIQEKAEEKC
jgi:PAS domain-containing protein